MYNKKYLNLNKTYKFKKNIIYIIYIMSSNMINEIMKKKKLEMKYEEEIKRSKPVDIVNKRTPEILSSTNEEWMDSFVFDRLPVGELVKKKILDDLGYIELQPFKLEYEDDGYEHVESVEEIKT